MRDSSYVMTLEERPRRDLPPLLLNSSKPHTPRNSRTPQGRVQKRIATLRGLEAGAEHGLPQPEALDEVQIRPREEAGEGEAVLPEQGDDGAPLQDNRRPRGEVLPHKGEVPRTEEGNLEWF